MMETRQEERQLPWLATLLIVWNLFDIGVHIAIDVVEPLRIAGSTRKSNQSNQKEKKRKNKTQVVKFSGCPYC
jgi:hypothetical protein